MQHNLNDGNWKLIEFNDRVKITDYFSTKSTVKVVAVSTVSNDKYAIFFSDFFDMLQTSDIEITADGVFIEGTFILVKRGDRFGIRLKYARTYNKSLETRVFPDQPVTTPFPIY